MEWLPLLFSGVSSLVSGWMGNNAANEATEQQSRAIRAAMEFQTNNLNKVLGLQGRTTDRILSQNRYAGAAANKSIRNARDSALKSQNAATGKAVGVQQGFYNKAKGNLAPWMKAGVDALEAYSGELGLGGADGTPYKFAGRREGRWIFAPFEAPLFYHNVLQGDYQDYVGGKYHAMEIFDFAYDAEEILNTKNPTAYPIISWVRISDWMPWMKMRGRQGQMVFNAMGNKLKSYDELPKVLKDEIALNYPIYNTPPPLDDQRPNETTWTVFKKWVAEKDGGKKAAPTAGH